MPSGPRSAPDINHLAIALTANHEQGGMPKTLVVTVTTNRGARLTDNACILRQGDHPFIKSVSFVLYAEALILDIKRIEKGLHREGWRRKDPLTPALLKRVTLGLENSARTPIKALLFFDDWCQNGVGA